MVNKLTCAFCDQPGKRSKEHAIPQWISDLKPQNVRLRTEGQHVGVKEWVTVTDKIQIITRAFCVECNTGWMSKLEDSAKPNLLQLIGGSEISLSAGTQATISSWAVKTAMVMEFTSASSKRLYFTPQERKQFSKNLQTPGNTFVFLASYVGPHFVWADEHCRTINAGGTTFPGYFATMVLGKLVLQIFSHRGHSGIRWSHGQDFSSAEIQVWPAVTNTIWPPEEVLDQTGLEQYALRWQ